MNGSSVSLKNVKMSLIFECDDCLMATHQCAHWHAICVYLSLYEIT
jgi:hypothetical protein